MENHSLRFVEVGMKMEKEGNVADVEYFYI